MLFCYRKKDYTRPSYFQQSDSSHTQKSRETHGVDVAVYRVCTACHMMSTGRCCMVGVAWWAPYSGRYTVGAVWWRASCSRGKGVCCSGLQQHTTKADGSHPPWSPAGSTPSHSRARCCSTPTNTPGQTLVVVSITQKIRPIHNSNTYTRCTSQSCTSRAAAAIAPLHKHCPPEANQASSCTVHLTRYIKSMPCVNGCACRAPDLTTFLNHLLCSVAPLLLHRRQ